MLPQEEPVTTMLPQQAPSTGANNIEPRASSLASEEMGIQEHPLSTKEFSLHRPHESKALEMPNQAAEV